MGIAQNLKLKISQNCTSFKNGTRIPNYNQNYNNSGTPIGQYDAMIVFVPEYKLVYPKMLPQA